MGDARRVGCGATREERDQLADLAGKAQAACRRAGRATARRAGRGRSGPPRARRPRSAARSRRAGVPGSPRPQRRQPTASSVSVSAVGVRSSRRAPPRCRGVRRVDRAEIGRPGPGPVYATRRAPSSCTVACSGASAAASLAESARALGSKIPASQRVTSRCSVAPARPALGRSCAVRADHDALHAAAAASAQTSRSRRGAGGGEHEVERRRQQHLRVRGGIEGRPCGPVGAAVEEEQRAQRGGPGLAGNSATMLSRSSDEHLGSSAAPAQAVRLGVVDARHRCARVCEQAIPVGARARVRRRRGSPRRGAQSSSASEVLPGARGAEQRDRAVAEHDRAGVEDLESAAAGRRRAAPGRSAAAARRASASVPGLQRSVPPSPERRLTPYAGPQMQVARVGVGLDLEDDGPVGVVVRRRPALRPRASQRVSVARLQHGDRELAAGRRRVRVLQEREQCVSTATSSPKTVARISLQLDEPAERAVPGVKDRFAVVLDPCVGEEVRGQVGRRSRAVAGMPRVASSCVSTSERDQAARVARAEGEAFAPPRARGGGLPRASSAPRRVSAPAHAAAQPLDDRRRSARACAHARACAQAATISPARPRAPGCCGARRRALAVRGSTGGRSGRWTPSISIKPRSSSDLQSSQMSSSMTLLGLLGTPRQHRAAASRTLSSAFERVEHARRPWR